MAAAKFNASKEDSNSRLDLISLDDQVILHGVAASLFPEDLEEFKQYLEKQYPEFIQYHDDQYFADRFTSYFCKATLDEGLKYSRKFLFERRPDVYETLVGIKMKPSKGKPISELSEEEMRYFL